MRTPILLLVSLSLIFATQARAQAPGVQLPTVDELKQKLKDGKTPEVLTSVSKLLALKGEAAKAYDRYELFSLRGEASLRNKAMLPAAEAFAAAQKETTDAQKQSVARANEILIRRSKVTGYTPKPAPRDSAGPATKPAGPIPIIEEEDRKRAFEALFADEMAVVEPKLKAAAASNNLLPVIDTARALADLGAIETAGTGASTQTKEIGASLGDHAHTLIKAGLDTMRQTTEHAWAQGSRRQARLDGYGNREYQYGMMGLTSNETRDLKDVIATAEKIIPVATQLGDVTASSELKQDGPEAEKVRDRAKEVLAYDYNNAGAYNPTGIGGQVTGQGPRQGTSRTGTGAGAGTGTSTGTGTGKGPGTQKP
jgi:hypothetical protein